MNPTEDTAQPGPVLRGTGQGSRRPTCYSRPIPLIGYAVCLGNEAVMTSGDYRALDPHRATEPGPKNLLCELLALGRAAVAPPFFLPGVNEIVVEAVVRPAPVLRTSVWIPSIGAVAPFFAAIDRQDGSVGGQNPATRQGLSRRTALQPRSQHDAAVGPLLFGFGCRWAR